MATEKCNGYKNWDTWDLIVWMDNTPENYAYTCANRDYLVNLPNDQLKKELRENIYIGNDKIAFSKVCYSEIKKHLTTE